MKRKKKVISLTLCLSAAFAAGVPLAPLAASPEFAKTAEEWERLRDDVLEYDELEDLIHEYNVTVLNNQQIYNRTMKGKSFDDITGDYMDAAGSYYDLAEKYRGQAEAFYDMSGDLTAAGVQLQAGAVQYEAQARQMENNAVTSNTDGVTVRTENALTEKKLVLEAQSTMNSYYKLQQQLIAAQKNRELQEAVLKSVQTKQEVQMATQAEVLAAEQSLQDADAQIVSLQSQIESARQKLIVMTGWKQDANPEIRPMPEVDFGRIAAMNPTVDLQKAVENDYTLKIDQRKANGAVTQENKAIYTQNVNDDKQKIGVALNNAYQAVTEAKNSYDEAVINLEVAGKEMNKASKQYALGSASMMEYRQAETKYVSAQTNLEAAKLSLLQAMEEYDWIVKGVR